MENRKGLRSRKRLQVRFGTEKPEHLGYTEDISPQGLFIQTAKVMKPGTRLQVRLTTREGRQILIEGHVRWAKGAPPQFLGKLRTGMGVMITSFVTGEEFFRGCLPEDAVDP